MLLRTFPDLHVASEDVIAEGDKVVYRNTVTSTHKGEYMGLQPTGKAISYNEIFIIGTATVESRRPGGGRHGFADVTARRATRKPSVTTAIKR